MTRQYQIDANLIWIAESESDSYYSEGLGSECLRKKREKVVKMQAYQNKLLNIIRTYGLAKIPGRAYRKQNGSADTAMAAIR